jgi:hypothetical protein
MAGMTLCAREVVPQRSFLPPWSFGAQVLNRKPCLAAREGCSPTGLNHSRRVKAMSSQPGGSAARSPTSPQQRPAPGSRGTPSVQQHPVRHDVRRRGGRDSREPPRSTSGDVPQQRGDRRGCLARGSYHHDLPVRCVPVEPVLGHWGRSGKRSAIDFGMMQTPRSLRTSSAAATMSFTSIVGLRSMPAARKARSTE